MREAEAIQQFRDAMRAAGLVPPEISASGKVYRFSTNGKASDDAGWCYLFPDLLGGVFGDHRTGLSETWQAKREKPLTEAESTAFKQRCEQVKQERQAGREHQQAKARERAQRLWRKAKAETGEHRYLRGKGVEAYGIRTDGQQLIIPMRDTAGVLHSLQFIPPDGRRKQFLKEGLVKGCYHAIGKPNGTLCVCEGYATGASIHEAAGHAVAVAFNADNLKAVAEALRTKYPDMRLVICADDDQWTNGNPGLTKATTAAHGINGLLAIPDFGDHRQEGATDFNDLHQHRGLDAVRTCIANANTPASDKDQSSSGNTPNSATANSIEAEVVITCAANVKPEPITWLWPGRIAIGKLSIIAGDPGLGKSMITIAMATHVTRATPWPVDCSDCPIGDVLMLSAEDDPADTIRPRLDAAGADVKRVHLLSMVRDVDSHTGEVTERGFSLKRDIPRLHAALAQLPQCRMVVIDPISAYMDGTDAHKNAEVRGLLTPLQKLAATRRVAVVAVDHLRKSDGKAIYRTVGSIGFPAAARSVLVVAQDPNNDARRLILPSKNNLGPDNGGLAYSITTTDGVPHLLWDSEPVTMTADEALSPRSDDIQAERNEAVEWLREVLADGPKAVKQLQAMARQAGLSWRTVRGAKDCLGIKPAKTRFDGGWTWALPTKIAKMPEDVQPTTDGYLRGKNEQKPHWNAASSEDGHVATFEGAHPAQDGHEDVHPTIGGHLRQNRHSKAIIENKNAEDGQPKKVDTFGEVGHLRESEPEDDVEVFEVPE